MNIVSVRIFVFFVTLSLFYRVSCKGGDKRWRKRRRKESTRRPHVVFVMADDYGYNDIGYNARSHHSQMQTPYLDILAKNGVILDKYYVQPICSPSRSQLMSGRYEIHTGLSHGVIKGRQPNALPLDNVILPQQLRKCGYRTHMVGKWHLGFYKNEYLPWNRGFQTFYGFLNGGTDYYTRYHCEPRKTRRFCGVDMVDSRKGPTNSTWGIYSGDLFTQRAKRLIEQHSKNKSKHKPMFLYMSLQSVHGPLQAPPKFQKRFRDIKDSKRRTYARMVLSMDRSIRKLVSFLKRAKMWKDTIFIFSTDNGGQTSRGGNNWPLRGRKGTLWEGGTRGVGFVYSKLLKLAAPYVNRQLIHISDWFPTIMSATKCPIVEGTQRLDGYDQWKTISENAATKRTEILHNIDPLYKKKLHREVRQGFDVSVRSAIRSGEWKLVTGDPGIGDWVKPPEWEAYQPTRNDLQTYENATKNINLYRISTDPYERDEVSDLYPEVVNLLLSRLTEYNASAVPVLYPKMQRRSDPKLHGGFWLPWRNRLPTTNRKKSRYSKKQQRLKWKKRKMTPASFQMFTSKRSVLLQPT